MVAQYLESIAGYGGVIAVALEWLSIALFYVLQPAGFDGVHPISYFAILPETRLAFSVCYCLAALSFWLFATHHLNRHYAVPTRVFSLSMIGFASVALIPFDPNSALSAGIHGLSAQVFSIAFLIGILLMAKRNDDPPLRRASLLAAVLGGLLLVLFFLLPKDSQLVLVLEASSGLIDQLWILWITYLAYKRMGEIGQKAGKPNL